MGATFGGAGALTPDFLIAVSLGLVPGFSLVRKFGAIDGLTASTDTDLWEYGTLGSGTAKYTFSDDDVADITLMSSSDADDSVAITIEGLDGDGNLVIQNKALNGQAQVELDTPLNRVNRAYNSNGTVLEGDVYIYTTDTTAPGGVPQIADQVNVRGFLNSTDSQTLQGPFSVPVGCVALILGLEASLSHVTVNPTGTVNITCKGIVREFSKIPRTQDEFDLIHRGDSSKNHNFPIPLPFPERSDFIPQVNSDTAGVGATWSYSILLVDKAIAGIP